MTSKLRMYHSRYVAKF